MDFSNLGETQLTAWRLALLLGKTGEENFASRGTFKSSAFDTHPKSREGTRGDALAESAGLLAWAWDSHSYSRGRSEGEEEWF